MTSDNQPRVAVTQVNYLTPNGQTYIISECVDESNEVKIKVVIPGVGSLLQQEDELPTLIAILTDFMSERRYGVRL